MFLCNRQLPPKDMGMYRRAPMIKASFTALPASASYRDPIMGGKGTEDRINPLTASSVIYKVSSASI